MNALRLALLALSSLTACRNLVETGVQTPNASPDGTKTLRVVPKDGGMLFEVRDLPKRQTSLTPAKCWPVSWVEWSPDARVVYAASHVAMGRAVEVLVESKGKWRSYVLDAPEAKDHDYFVVDWNIKSTVAEVKIVVLLSRLEKGWPIYEVTFDLEPFSGEISRIRGRRNLTREQWNSYVSRFDRR